MSEPNDPQQGLQRFLDKFSNDTAKALGQLWADNFQLREEKRQMNEAHEATKKLLPPEGAIVLTKTDAARWAEYQAFGKPDELKAALAERDTLKGQVAKAARVETMRKVAEASGFNADVLTELAKENHAFEVKEITAEGKTIKQAYIVVTGSDGKTLEKPLEEFANENWKNFLPALKPAGTPDNPRRQAPEGTPYLPQKPGAPPKPEDGVEAQRIKLASSGDYGL